MTQTIHAPPALPLYIQIAELLIRDIAAGRLVDGERLPPERTLALTLGTTVTTLRKALAHMTDLGVLERRHGSGNYIKVTNTRALIYGMFRLELPKGGGLPRAKILSVDAMDKSDDLPAFGTHKMATRIRRQRYLDDTLVALEEIWLDQSAGTVQRETLIDSLYAYYRAHLGFWITRAEDRVGVAILPDWCPHNHCQVPGDITGYVERFSWANAPRPIEFSRTWFDPSRALYTQRLI